MRQMGEALIGIVLLGLIGIVIVTGYLAGACGFDGSTSLMAVLAVLVVSITIPPVGLAWLIAGVAIGIGTRLLHADTRFWKWLPVVAGGTLISAAAAAAIAASDLVHEHCGLI